LQQSVPQVSGLSSDPSTLAQELAEGFDDSNVDRIASGPSAVFQRAARLLVGPDSGMTGSLASAIYQVMADQSGVTLLGNTTDHSGRQGIGVSMSSPTGVSELIIDPQSGSALEIQYSPPASSISAPPGATVRCLTVSSCGSLVEKNPPLGSTEVVAPIWTDTVTSGIVNAEGATEPVGSPNA
jgi:hypothetical protein